MPDAFCCKRFMLSLAVAALALQGCQQTPDDAGKPVQAPASAASIARGKYLTTAADCISCHSAPGQGAFSGGYALATPYGPIYGSNITPDKETGIGHYRREDLYRVLHEGRRPDGSPLYPAMPYTSYRQISRADSDAIYDYLMSRPAIRHANLPPGFHFPFSMRSLMLGWQWLFLSDAPPALEKTTPQWQRGAYLAGALAHCTECHTPRNSLGALKSDAQFKGAMIGRYEAPDITPQALAQRGWTAQGLAQLLGTGIAPQGSAYADMFPVVHNSTRYLSRDDIASMVSFLGGPDGLPSPAHLTPVAMAPEALQRGWSSYANLCAGCHGQQGEGKPHVAPALRANTSLRLPSPNNLLVAMLDGVGEQSFSQLERMQAMPGVPRFISDQQVADLANTLRAQWGGQPATIDADTVRKLRTAHAQ